MYFQYALKKMWVTVIQSVYLGSGCGKAGYTLYRTAAW